MLFLDAANLENGCLHVVPGSHLKGEWPKRATGDRFADNELDPDAFGELTQVPVEVEAGSLVLFGPLLVHQSAPNTSPTQRRALLYSYQPPGRRTQVDNLRRLGERAEG
jgi:phytanoyl-CoA hydroxylase